MRLPTRDAIIKNTDRPCLSQPRDRKTLQPNALRPEQRELVFDIDMTDYDEIRTCCSGGAICRRCWGYIAGAVKVLDQVLRGEFGRKCQSIVSF